MKRNEQTSPEVAKIAAQVLKRLELAEDEAIVAAAFKKICTIGQLKKLAASALTQTRDKKPIKKARTK